MLVTAAIFFSSIHTQRCPKYHDITFFVLQQCTSGTTQCSCTQAMLSLSFQELVSIPDQAKASQRQSDNCRLMGPIVMDVISNVDKKVDAT